MELEIKPYNSYCSLEIFKINGIDADYHDFGDKEDIAEANAPDWGCGNMQFIPKLPTQKVLDKYRINADDYIKITEALDCLSFGECAWCS